MANVTLNAQMREGAGKGFARKLRQAGRVPAVVYGRDLDPVHVSVDAREAGHLFHSISVDNTLVDIVVEGVKTPFATLVREIQTHPLRANLVHIDFLRIQAGVKVDVEIPIELLGVPVGVRLNGGTLEQVLHELQVRCVPSQIPETIPVDVSGLDLEDAIHVGDLTMAEGVECLAEADQTICVIGVPRSGGDDEAEEDDGVEEDGDASGDDSE